METYGPVSLTAGAHTVLGESHVPADSFRSAPEVDGVDRYGLPSLDHAHGYGSSEKALAYLIVLILDIEGFDSPVPQTDESFWGIVIKCQQCVFEIDFTFPKTVFRTVLGYHLGGFLRVFGGIGDCKQAIVSLSDTAYICYRPRSRRTHIRNRG